MADDLVQVLSPAEKATALLGAQSYVTLALVLSIRSFISLIKHVAKEKTKAAAKQGAVKYALGHFVPHYHWSSRKSLD